MSDFLSRENEFLGGAFSPSAGGHAASNVNDIDLDRAASAFPDIDFDGDIPVPAAPQRSTLNKDGSFGFDINSLTSPPAQPDVKVTGGDEIDKFESAFPDIGPTPQVPIMLLEC